MRYLVVIICSFLMAGSVTFGKKEQPPFAQTLTVPQEVGVLFWSNSNQTQYLGFDWINSYCFGRVLGCAVTDEPATAEYSYGEILFRSGDWLIYATCFGDGPGMQIQWLAPCWKPGATVEVSPTKNMRTILIGDPGTKLHRWRGHTYTVVSAFNNETKQLWGPGTLDAWRIVIAAIGITDQLKTMSLDEQLTWSTKIFALRDAGLVNADNLEKLLAEMRHSETEASHQTRP